MKATLRILAVLVAIAALMLVALPTQAETGGASCFADPSSGPVGTVFAISCSGFSANTHLNVYAVEPDGRASGLDIYGFFPTNIKTDKTGSAGFDFVTEFSFFSVPPGDYIFVVHELVPDGGGAVAAEVHLPITVEASPRDLLGGVLTNTLVSADTVTKNVTFAFFGSGWVPGEAVSIWVSQPPATQCSGLGIDQLTLGALGAGSSSLWSGPGTVKADASGSIAFDIAFRPAACRGDYIVSARALGSGIGAETGLTLDGFSVRAANAVVSVSPSSVPAFNSFHTVSGSGFPANTTVNCWYTRPDGRVLGFIDVNATTDASGSFSVGNMLDDFPPFTSTEPGWWYVTCATPDRSFLAETSFLVYGLVSDP